MLIGTPSAERRYLTRSGERERGSCEGKGLEKHAHENVKNKSSLAKRTCMYQVTLGSVLFSSLPFSLSEKILLFPSAVYKF